MSKIVNKNLCSNYSLNINESPIGSASNFDKYLLIGVPTPWKSEITESEKFPKKIKALLQENPNLLKSTKILGFNTETKYDDVDKTHIILFAKPKGNFENFSKFEFVSNQKNLEELILHLLNSNYKNHPSEINQNNNSRDLLICIHGARDTCCASIGYPIYEKILTSKKSFKVNAIQVSHIGGHRFAPNIIDMPDGRNWVKLSKDSIDSFISQKKPLNSFTENYRGWTILKNGFEQVAEREAFSIEGWDWIHKKILSIQTLETKNLLNSKLIEIKYCNSDGTKNKEIHVEVKKTEKLPVLKCTKNEITEYSQQYEVIKVTRN